LTELLRDGDDEDDTFQDYLVKMIWEMVEQYRKKTASDGVKSEGKSKAQASSSSDGEGISRNHPTATKTTTSEGLQEPSRKRRRYERDDFANENQNASPPKKRQHVEERRGGYEDSNSRIKRESHHDRPQPSYPPRGESSRYHDSARIKTERSSPYPPTPMSHRDHHRDSKMQSVPPRGGRLAPPPQKSFKSSTSEDKLFVNRIYECSVDSIQNYGFFSTIRSTLDAVPVTGRREGLCHINNMSTQHIRRVTDLVQRGDTVLCKITSIFGAKISLSMKDVDQKTGRDLDPQEIYAEDDKRAQVNPDSMLQKSQRRKPEKKKIIADDFDAWETAQLQKAGLWKPSDAPEEIINRHNDEIEEELEIELNDDEPMFLKGQTFKGHSRAGGSNHEPSELLKKPIGSMLRAAENSLELAKERREMRERQRAMALGDTGVLEQQQDRRDNLGWEDPLQMEEKGLQNDYRMNQPAAPAEAVPEWKKEGLGTTGRITDLSIKDQRESLPIFKLRDHLVNCIRENQLVVVVGETGSGKTTQITQYLEEEGFCNNGRMIGCTQPRRVAAVSVAKRVAEEYGCKCGEEVGFTIRFEDKTSDKTRVKYMTDGMLLRETLTDEMLSRYSVIMLDEAHERQLHTDVLFGLLKKLTERRKDIKIIITSATLDSEKFSKYFFDCPVFPIPGRTYPVEILHANDPETDYLDAALITVMQIHLTEEPGDILVFLTGQEEIDTACQILYERMKALGNDVPELVILPIYSALPSEMQSRIFDPAKPGTRKVILATNIAETSITIDGIYYVVDPGFVKQNYYNPRTKVDTLQVVPISQAAARQRAGRAGRTGPGKCYRLYTEKAFNDELPPNTMPEIQRTNMSNTVLNLKVMGINDLLNFDFMDPPPSQSIVAAMEQLFALGALDDEGLLTKLGRQMAEFPLEPQMSKALLASVDYECSEEMLTIVSMLNVQNVFYRPKDKATQADQKKAKFFQPEGDHLTMLAVYMSWQENNFSKSWSYDNFLHDRSLRRAQDVKQQLTGIFERKKFPIRSCRGKYINVRKAITSGYFAQAARRDPQDGFRTLVDGQVVYLHPGSSLFHKTPDWVIYHSLVHTTKEYMHEIIWIDPKWLVEVAPAFYKKVPSHKLSRRQKREKIEPLFDKYAEHQDEWRLSYRVKQFKKFRNR